MQNEGRVMRSYSSSEQLLQQVASLKEELKECRTQRKESEDKYKRVLDSRFEGFMLLDENRVIIEVNKALLKISGYDRNDFIGHLVDKFYDKASLNFYSASPDHFSFEALFRAKGGCLIPMLFSRSTLNDENHQITGYMVFLTDLTDLKETQEELKRAASTSGLFCQGCGQCVKQCIAELPIPDLMRAYMYTYDYRNLALAKGLVVSLGLPGRVCEDCSSCPVRCSIGFNVPAKIRDIVRLRDVPTEFLS